MSCQRTHSAIRLAGGGEGRGGEGREGRGGEGRGGEGRGGEGRGGEDVCTLFSHKKEPTDVGLKSLSL